MDVFLLTLLSGVITSILLFSWLLEWLFKNESIGLWSFFFGILLASFIFLIKIEIQKKTISFFFTFNWNCYLIPNNNCSKFHPNCLSLVYIYNWFFWNYSYDSTRNIWSIYSSFNGCLSNNLIKY